MQSSVILRTGQEVATPVVTIVMTALESLFKNSPIPFAELVAICRDPNHKLFGNSGKILKELNLIEGSGQPHDDTRLVVLAAAEGEGANLRLVNPIRNDDTKRALSRIRNLHDNDFYLLTLRVAEVIFEYASYAGNLNSEKPWVEDCRKGGPNPYYNQTADGLYLEISYDIPFSLWTPWGEWQLTASGHDSWEKILSAPLERLGAMVHQEMRCNTADPHGPVYALHKVDDVLLPPPMELNRKAYASSKDSRAAWEELTMKYRSAKKT